MLQLVNPSSFIVHPCVFPNIQGVDTIYAFIKGTFDLKGNLLPAPKQTPVNVPDKFEGEPLKSQLKAATDISLGKPGTDVLLAGHAYGRLGDSSGFVDVSLSVATVAKTVRVFGERRWVQHLFGLKTSLPEPFEKRRLSWECAYGGTDEIFGDKPRVESDPRNPLGCGFRVNPKAKSFVDQLLPAQEYPATLLKSWSDRPAPASFGAIPAHWQPRVGYAGTYDEAWQKGCAPYLPPDFNPKFFCTAPADQIVLDHLKGGEPIEVRGASPEGRLCLEVPRWQHEVTMVFDHEEETSRARLETLLIDLDAGQLVLTWVASMVCDRRALQVREIKLKPILNL